MSASGFGGRHQPGPGPGLVGRQLLLLAALLSFPGPGCGNLDPTVAKDLAAVAAAALGSGQRAAGGAGRWHQAAQGGPEDAGGQKPASGVPLQCQGFFHHGPLAAGRRVIGAGGGSLLEAVSGRPHPRGHRLEQSGPAHLVGQTGRVALGFGVG